MRRALKNMLMGAGSLLDITGHSPVSQPQPHSIRVESENEFYTSPLSDGLNLACDGSAVAHDLRQAVAKISAEK